MNQYEEALQKSIEEGQAPKGDGLDIRAYQEIFRALKKDPGYELPAGLASRLVDRIIEKRKNRFSTDLFWYCGGILFLIVSLLATIFYTGFKLDFGFLKGMGNYRGLLVFGFLFIALLNWLDKKFIKPDKSITTN